MGLKGLSLLLPLCIEECVECTDVAVVCWLLNVPATCWCISGTDLLRQFDVLPHWDRTCRSNFPPHSVTVYWHRQNQSQRWPYNARRLAGKPLECQFLSHWYDSTPKKSRRKRDSNPGSSALVADEFTTRPTRRHVPMTTPEPTVSGVGGEISKSYRRQQVEP